MKLLQEGRGTLLGWRDPAEDLRLLREEIDPSGIVIGK